MNGKMRKRTGPAGWIVVALIASALIVGALHPTYCQTPEGYVYRAPEQTADGLETGSLADAGIDIASVEAMMNALLTDKIDNIHSVLLIKDGKLVLEEYLDGFDRETLHSIQSDTKSVSSILIGIATDRVLFTDLDRKIASFFPNYENVMKPAWKDKITLRHCLTMTAGIEWNEWGVPYEDPKNEYASLNNRLDLFDYIFQKDLVDTPGTEFNYCGGQSLILGGVIQNTSNLYADQFAEMFLFKPLGIRKFDWWKHQDGAIRTDGGLRLRPRDMAKIGLLFLQNGRWKDRHILSERWVTESVKERTSKAISFSDRDTDTNGGTAPQWLKIRPFTPSSRSAAAGNTSSSSPNSLCGRLYQPGQVQQIRRLQTSGPVHQLPPFGHDTRLPAQTGRGKPYPSRAMFGTIHDATRSLAHATLSRKRNALLSRPSGR